MERPQGSAGCRPRRKDPSRCAHPKASRSRQARRRTRPSPYWGVNGGRFFSALRLARITPLEPARGGRALLELPDGAPVLVVGSVGSGQVMVWGSTCDRDWTDLAVRPVFVPFMRGVSDFLGGTHKGVSSFADAGDAFEIRASLRRVG